MNNATFSESLISSRGKDAFLRLGEGVQVAVSTPEISWREGVLHLSHLFFSLSETSKVGLVFGGK